MRYLCALLAFTLVSCGADSTPNNEVAPIALSPTGNLSLDRGPPQKEQEVEIYTGNLSLDREPSHKRTGDIAATGRRWGKYKVHRADHFRFTSTTRISIDPKITQHIAEATQLPEVNEYRLSRTVFEPCFRTLLSNGRSYSIVARPGQIANDGVNVIIELVIEPNAKGLPYRVALRASQGEARWSASIERPYYRRPSGRIVIQPNGTTPDGLPYWDPVYDTRALAKRLCDHILGRGVAAGKD